jgi:hypothetical protein
MLETSLNYRISRMSRMLRIEQNSVARSLLKTPVAVLLIRGGVRENPKDPIFKIVSSVPARVGGSG